MFQNNIPDLLTNAMKLPNVNLDNLMQLYFQKIFRSTNTKPFLTIRPTDLLTNQSQVYPALEVTTEG